MPERIRRLPRADTVADSSQRMQAAVVVMAAIGQFALRASFARPQGMGDHVRRRIATLDLATAVRIVITVDARIESMVRLPPHRSALGGERHVAHLPQER